MPENERGFRPPEVTETKSEKRPEKLFRSITLKPEDLTLERLKQTLVPGNVNKDDPTKIGDGNELGVYMTTNFMVADKAYARGGAITQIETPAYDDGRTIVKHVTLPSCGVIYEINTNGLTIREPEIAPVWKGHYNNGFEGKEWIADKIPPEFYKINKLILSRSANDQEAFSLSIDDTSDTGLQTAIETIKKEFENRKAAANKFKEFLTTLNDGQRRNNYKIKKWQIENK